MKAPGICMTYSECRDPIRTPLWVVYFLLAANSWGTRKHGTLVVYFEKFGLTIEHIFEIIKWQAACGIVYTCNEHLVGYWPGNVHIWKQSNCKGYVSYI